MPSGTGSWSSCANPSDIVLPSDRKIVPREFTEELRMEMRAQFQSLAWSCRIDDGMRASFIPLRLENNPWPESESVEVSALANDDWDFC